MASWVNMQILVFHCQGVELLGDFTNVLRYRVENKDQESSVKTGEEYDAILKVRRRSKVACIKAILGRKLEIRAQKNICNKSCSLRDQGVYVLVIDYVERHIIGDLEKVPRSRKLMGTRRSIRV